MREEDMDILEAAVAEVGAGRRVPYLGAGVAALSGGAAPTTPAALCASLEARVRVPRRAHGNLWSAAQYIESRRFRATLDKMVAETFAGDDPAPNPVQRWLANVRPPMVVDAWYDDGLLHAYGEGTPDWGWVQGVNRHNEWALIWTKAYDSAGRQVPEADPSWPSLIYKPHGLARGAFLMSDSDYVEVLTEIDIQSPIPEEVQNRRRGRPFLFLGCRFDDQTLRIFARQIAKRSAAGHIAVIEGELTRMEQKFLDELGIRRLDLPLSAVADLLSIPEG